ncbi:MAG: CHASE2 domain-containing sensor protein [Oleispira sp.]
MLGFKVNRNKANNLMAGSGLQAVQRADWKKIIISLLMASAVVLINLSDTLRLPELLVYDALVFHSYDKPQQNHVLLLEVSSDELNRSPEFMGSITDRLLARSPQKIVIMNSLNQLDKPQQQTWLKNEQVGYAPLVYPTLQDGDILGHKYAKSNALSQIPPIGFSLPASSNFGITRAMPLEVLTHEGALHSFQAQLTNAYTLNSDSIYINFNQGTSPIPRYQAKKLLEIGIIDELVKDKFILITAPLNNSISGLTTPKNNYAEPLSADLIQGMALNSLINQTDIGMLKPWQAAIICFVLFIFYLFAFQWLNIRFATLIIVTSAMVLLAIDWYLLSFHYLYLPVFSFIVAIIAALFTAIPLHRIKEQSVINTLHFDILSQLKSKKTPYSFYQVEDPWNHIIVFINQHLLLNRSILLERVENDHRVKEIKSLGCSIDDIAEQRRDYTRFPYDQSLQQQIPLNLDNRQYFKQSFEGEKQFLIPLRFAEEVLGFWAFTVIPDDKWDQNKFFSDINIFAKQIGLLIHNRKAFNYEDNINSKLLTQLLNFNLGSGNHKSLKSAVDGLSHRLRIMEGIFDGLSSAAMLYDLFGQIISSNHLMEQLARQSHLSIYDLTSLDLISQACGISKDEARSRLRHVALNSATIDLPLSELIDDRQYLLRIRSIKPKIQTVKSLNDNDLPFELLGILFEFINVTPIQQRFTTDIIVYENLYSMLRNDFSALSLCQLQLSSSTATDQKLMAQMDQTLQHCTEIVTNAETLLNDTASNLASTGKLLQPLELLKRVLIEIKESADKANLSLDTSLPTFSSIIFIDEDELATLLIQSFHLLIEDAVPDTPIKLFFKEHERTDKLLHNGKIVITLSNIGYGMPQAELNAERKDTSYIETDTLLLFKKAVMNISPWQVIVTSTSQVGTGFEINIELPVINFYRTIEI